MKNLVALPLVLVAFGSGTLLQRHTDQKRIWQVPASFHLSSPYTADTPGQWLYPSGVELWQCLPLNTGAVPVFYAPAATGVANPPSECKQVGVAKIVFQLE
jgi:hypothetical protein